MSLNFVKILHFPVHQQDMLNFVKHNAPPPALIKISLFQLKIVKFGVM